MVDVTVKESKLGGKRKPSKLKKATQRLLKVLWEKNEGVYHVAEMIGVNPQNLINWRNAGKVPLTSVGRLGRILNVAPEVLNYEDAGEFFGVSIPWDSLLNVLELTPQELSYITKGQPPKPYKGV